MEISTDFKKSRRSFKKSVHYQGDFPINFLTKEEYLIQKHIPSELPDNKSSYQPLEGLFFTPNPTKNPKECLFQKQEVVNSEAQLLVLQEKEEALKDLQEQLEQAEIFIRDLLEQLTHKDENIRELEEKNNAKVNLESFSKEIQVFIEDPAHNEEDIAAMKEELIYLREEMHQRNGIILERDEIIGDLNKCLNEKVMNFEELNIEKQNNEKLFEGLKDLIKEFMGSKEELFDNFIQIILKEKSRLDIIEKSLKRTEEISIKNKEIEKKNTQLLKRISEMEFSLEALNEKMNTGKFI